MDIAVIVPCKNAEPWICELLDSVLSQALQPCEVAIVDDGSSDGTVRQVAAWADHHQPLWPVRVLATPAGQRGVAAALATGVSNTAAELIVRVDADDLLRPTFLEALHGALVKDPRAAYSYCAMQMFGSAHGRYHVRSFDAAALVYEGNFVPACALMRRAAYERAGGVADLPAWEDWDLWLRLLEHGLTGVFVDEELYLWRRHRSSRNTLSLRRRRLLRLRIWWRHRGLLARYFRAGWPMAVRRLRQPVRQQ